MGKRSYNKALKYFTVSLSWTLGCKKAMLEAVREAKAQYTKNAGHRGSYAPTREHLQAVARYLHAHLGNINRAELARSTGLSKDQAKQAIDALSFEDPRLWENDTGQLFYL